MKKRFAVLGLIAVLIISIVAIGCGGDNGGSNATPAMKTATPTIQPTEEPGEPGELPENYQFYMEWSDSEGNSGQMQFWVKGEKWRTDWGSTQDEVETQMVLMHDGEFGYLYMPSMNQVMRYATSWEMANPGQAYAQEFEDSYWGEVSDETILAGLQAACSGSAFIDGQEDIDGTSCTKFTCNFADGSVSHYWIADSGWLVKGEVTSSEGYTYTMQYSNIEFNGDIDDSIFDIDTIAPGVPIVDV